MKCFCPGTWSLWVCAVITSQGCWWGCKNLILLLLQGHCGHVPALLYSPLSPGSRWVLSTKYKILFWTCQRCFPCQGPSWVLSRASVSFSYRLYRCQSHPESRTLGQKWRIESKNELYSPKRVCTFFIGFNRSREKSWRFWFLFRMNKFLIKSSWSRSDSQLNTPQTPHLKPGNPVLWARTLRAVCLHQQPIHGAEMLVPLTGQSHHGPNLGSRWYIRLEVNRS